jgi:hypothetical protein
MSKLSCALGAIVVFTLLAFGFLRVQPDALAFNCASCTSEDQSNCEAFGAWIVWCASPPSADLQTTADSEGDFSVYTEVKWCDANVGTHGAFEVVPESDENIVVIEGVVQVFYDPAYYFPNDHCEILGVTITGTLEDEDEDGYVNNRVWKWPPYRSDEIGLDILASS